MGVFVGVQVLQQSADIGWAARDKVKIGRRYIGIASIHVTVEQAERDESVQEIAGAAFVNPNLIPKPIKLEGAIGERAKDIEFNRAQQRLRFSERIPKLHDALWRERGSLYLAPSCKPV